MTKPFLYERSFINGRRFCSIAWFYAMLVSAAQTDTKKIVPFDAKVVIFRISRESGGRMGDLTPHGV